MVFRSWVAALLLGLLGAVTARAETQPPRVELRWSAPRECPDALAMVRAVEDFLGQPLAEAGAQRVEIDARVHGDRVHVQRGMFSLTVPPRFESPDEAGRAGTTVAPMPGKVVHLLVATGDKVAAGQPLLTIEAMKMEHQIVAPHTGVVIDVFVTTGQQLDHGQPLLRVE